MFNLSLDSNHRLSEPFQILGIGMSDQKSVDLTQTQTVQ